MCLPLRPGNASIQIMIGFAPGPLYEPALEILLRLRKAGHEAYVAGGAVRDHLLGRTQSDLDIATSAPPEQVRALFRHTFAVGEAFGVVIVRSRGHDYEVATFREEDEYQDGRRPSQVHYSTAKADVTRRDFTINGMLWDPEHEEVLDWVGGREDIRLRRVRTIGDPDARFGEDRLRMLRALRFCAQLDFELDPATLAAIQRHACHISVVSLERIRLELEKLLTAASAERGLALLEPSGLGRQLSLLLRAEARLAAHEYDNLVDNHWNWPWTQGWLRTRGERSSAAALPALAFFLLDVLQGADKRWHPQHATQAQQSMEALGRGLRMSRAELTGLRSLAWLLSQAPAFADLRLADQLRWLRRPEVEWLLPVLREQVDRTLPPIELMDDLIDRHRDHWHASPLLRGEELQALGWSSGPSLGRLLGELESLQLEGRLRTSAEARAWVAGHPRTP